MRQESPRPGVEFNSSKEMTKIESKLDFGILLQQPGMLNMECHPEAIAPHFSGFSRKIKFIANCVVPVNSIKQVCKYEN